MLRFYFLSIWLVTHSPLSTTAESTRRPPPTTSRSLRETPLTSLPILQLNESSNWPNPNSWKRSGALNAAEYGSYDGAVGKDNKVSLWKSYATLQFKVLVRNPPDTSRPNFYIFFFKKIIILPLLSSSVLLDLLVSSWFFRKSSRGCCRF